MKTTRTPTHSVAVYSVRLPPASCTSRPVHSSKLDDVQSACAKNKTGSCERLRAAYQTQRRAAPLPPRVTIASSFPGLRSFRQMLNKSERRTPRVVVAGSSRLHTHTCPHTHTLKRPFVKRLLCGPVGFIIKGDTEKKKKKKRN